MPAGIWLGEFNVESMCLVVSSELYSEDEYMRDYDEYLRFRGCDEGWWIAISVSRSWKGQRALCGAALKEACARVIDGGRYIGGDEVERFESGIGGLLRVRHTVGSEQRA